MPTVLAELRRSRIVLPALALAGWLVCGAPARSGPAPAKAPKAKARAAAEAGPVETRFIQVFPAFKDPEKWDRSKGRRRAVVLIHGYWLHFKPDWITKAVFKDWQTPGSALVKALGKDADVFAFAYGQTVSVEEVAHLPQLRAGISRLRKLGYSEVVLVGHSAGGLVARFFVEDYPRAGVTKVVQVCSPNGGCGYAEVQLVPKLQRAFVASLSRAGREKCLQGRSGKKIPAGVEFVCVVTAEDFVVPCKCQWTEDLQDQGIPAVRMALGHRQVMRKPKAARKLAEVVRERQPRWDSSHVADARKAILKARKAKGLH